MKHYCVMEVMQGAAVTHRPSPAHLHSFQVNVWLHRPADGESTALNDLAVLFIKKLPPMRSSAIMSIHGGQRWSFGGSPIR